MAIEFGTDGWRAVISEDFTFDNVRIVAQAIAEQTLAEYQGKYSGTISFVVGFDTRFLSDRYAILVAEVLAANGIHVWLTKADAPTPMVSYAIVDKKAQGGVMITASHNPPRYNGIKLKGSFGGSASPATCKDVERRIVHGVTPKMLELGQDAIDRGKADVESVGQQVPVDVLGGDVSRRTFILQFVEEVEYLQARIGCLEADALEVVGMGHWRDAQRRAEWPAMI